MSFKITRYTPLNSGGSTIGFLSFTIEKTGMFFNDCRVIRRGNGDFFVAAPSRAYDGRDGQKRYMCYWGFEDLETSERFQAGLMQAVRAHWERLKQEQQAKAQPAPVMHPQAVNQPPAQEFDDSECPF